MSHYVHPSAEHSFRQGARCANAQIFLGQCLPAAGTVAQARGSASINDCLLNVDTSSLQLTAVLLFVRWDQVESNISQ